MIIETHMGDIEIQEASFHRNGVCGKGFYAIRFRWQPCGRDAEENFIATLFDSKGYCTVLSLDRMESNGVAFAEGNSWRGDNFEPYLRKAIDRGDVVKGVRVGPFAMP